MIKVGFYLITATTLDPMRVGGKDDPLSEADNPLAIVGGRVCIPGPSLKGALRAELERYLNDQMYDTKTSRWRSEHAASQPCIPSTRFSPDERQLISSGHFRSRACRYPSDNESICPVCYLLGTQGLVGFVKVPFLFTNVTYSELYSARLDRSSRSVAEKTNRSYQLIPPETNFKGTLEVIRSDDLLGWELGKIRPLKESTLGDAWIRSDWTADKILNELLIDRLTAIRSIGGYRSKGFGGVRIEVIPLDTPKK
jgi:CRISPR/Cas system CSM-associated protein Csm3 (group 7 of RAMP superfamily)